LRENQRVKLFEKRVLREIFGHKRGEEIGDWRKLHNEELRDLCCSLNIIRMVKSRRTRQMGRVAYIYIEGEKRNAYRNLVGKLEWKISLCTIRPIFKNQVTDIMPPLTLYVITSFSQ
jgi:hypothetical protein